MKAALAIRGRKFFAGRSRRMLNTVSHSPEGMIVEEVAEEMAARAYEGKYVGEPLRFELYFGLSFDLFSMPPA